jgi:amino acid adenylation domain-containing protein
MSDRSAKALFRVPSQSPTHVPAGAGSRPDPTERLDLPPTRTVLDDIEMQAAQRPEAVAVDDGVTTRTFAELWRAAGAQGALLARAGVDASSRVVVTGRRDAAFVTALVGVLRSGATAVPVPAGLPAERAAAMVAGSGATHLVHTGRGPGWAGDLRVVDTCTAGDGAPTVDVDPTRPACVYFTSGSTGTPRAVAVGHAAIARLAAWHRKAFALAPGDRVGLVTSTGSVASARMVLGSLAAGATVVPAPDDLLPEEGLVWLSDHHVTVVHLTPSRARTWVAHAPSPRPRTSLRCTSFGGEALTDALVRDWREITDDRAQVVTIYGTTETGGACSSFVVPDHPVAGRQPLGWPVPGTQLLVLDGEGNLCEDGVTGEIAVRAATVARGYENDLETSEARFGPNPFTGDPDDPVYRTGDMGWYRSDGSVMFAGRRDDQVNLDGARVELGEVAACLEAHPRVRAAHVEPDVDPSGRTKLVAFIAAAHERGDEREQGEHGEGRERLDAALRSWCSTVLPAVAIPSQFVTVPDLPTSAAGKVDRQALLPLLAAGHPPREVRPDPTVPLADPAPGTVIDDIERHVAADPGAPALDDGIVALTYDELWARAGAIAGALAARGVTTEDRVMLTGPRSTAFAAAALGVLRAGAVLVPCASTLPPARCAAMATEAAARQVVAVGTPPDWADGLDTLVVDRHAVPVAAVAPDAPAAREPAPVGPHAVIFFTSGTTGTPKAVLGRHASIAHYLRWWRATFDVRPGDRVAMATSTAFDVTLRNLFGPLSAGATVCIAPDDLLPEDGLSWLARAQVHVLHVTPSLAQAWLTEAVDASSARERPLRWTLFAGEMLTDDLVRRWRAVNPGRIGNMYGPTETTMSRCLYVVPDEPVAGPQPVGFPLPGSQVLVVDEHDALCAVGQPGEVLIRTRSGTAGYANDPALQAARFVTNPFTGNPADVVYRTGDVGSYRPDGALQLSGRVDDQVKIGGVRVEPAEVAAVLGAHDDVRAAHVLVHRDGDGPTLVAYVAASGSDRLRAALRRRCGEALPAAAIPTAFVFVDRLPLTPNGKVDRAALAALGTPSAAPTAHDGPAAPGARDGDDAAVPVLTLDTVVELWRDVLRRDDADADTNFFDAGGTSVTAVRLAHRLRAYLDEPPTLLDLLEHQTPRALALHLRATTAGGPATAPVPVHRLVAARARTAPHDVALDDGSAGAGYATLEHQVRAVAGALVRAGVRPGSLVAVHTRRIASVVPVLLGIHRAGAGYVPVDPELPSGRVAFLLEDTAPAVVVSDRPIATTAPVVTLAELEAHMARADGSTADVEVADDPERVAYVIYTSGSTGNPKGVLVPHQALCAYVDASNDHFRLRPGDRLLQYHSLSFDSSVEEIFCTLAAGATLVLPGTPMLGSAGWFVDEIDRLRITVLDLPTSYWTGLVDDLVDGGLSLPATVRSVVIGGSAADARTVSRWNAHVHGVTLLNIYGPTEVTIAATIADLGDLRTADEPVTIGPPLRGVHALVVDEHDRPVVDGAPGELLLGGAQLALGYLDRPELTAERFVVDPTGATDERYYRTGDRVRRLPDGSLVFEGRIDDQVKIRGFRIELGEVEAVFGSHPDVREAVAVVEGVGADARLVVHLTFHAGRTVPVAELRAHASARLPSYAVPASIEPRAELPRTAGGKPDRRALRSGVRAPLGFAQEQQWFLSRLDPRTPAYNMATGVLLDGPLDAHPLELALNLVVERHETFRTRYVDDDGVPSQVIDAPAPLRLERLRAEAVDGESTFDAAVRTHLERGAEPFDLASDTLLRPALIEIGPDRHLLSLCTHHIAVDGWSIDLLVDDLRAAYAAYAGGCVPALPAVDAQPRDLAARDRAHERDGSLARALDHWQQRLTPLPPTLALPLDRPRPATRDPQGATVEVACAEGTAESLRAAARALRTTAFSAGLALFGEYLAARTSAGDLVIGVPTAGRDEPDSQRTIAMRVATLPHRHRSDASRTVQEAIVETTRRLWEDLASTPAPFDHIVRRLQPPREPGLHPIFQVTFQTGSGPVRYGPMHDVEVRPLGIGRGSAKFDLSCTLVTTDELVCSFVFARDVFDEPTMHELAAGFARFVDVALEDVRRPLREVVSRSSSAPMRGPDRRDAAPVTEPPRRHTADSGDDELLASVRAAFADVLGHAVGADDDFFAVGGHSLLAVRLCSRLERETGVRLGLASVFDAPTPRRLAALLRGEDPSSARAETDAHDDVLSLAQERMSVEEAPAEEAPAAPVRAERIPTPARGRDARLDRPARLWLSRAPMSFAQRRVWLLERLGVAADAYLLTSTFEVFGHLDVEALRRALEATAQRHEVLRTRFVETDDGLAEQVIDPEPLVELRVLDPGDDRRSDAHVEARIEADLRRAARQPFDLAHQHPWRAVLAHLGDGHALLALTVHHLATDGESQELIRRDLFAAYRALASGSTPDLDPPLLQYADHAVWQHARASSNAFDDALGFWRETFHTLPDALELPSARPRATDDPTGADVVVHGGAARSERLRSFARANGTTPFAVLLGTYAVLLHRLTGRRDIVVGIPVTERTMDLDTDTVGFFVNTVPVRVHIDPSMPLADAFAETRRAMREAIAHADAPLDLILDRLDVPRDATTNPLIPTMFSMQERAGTAGTQLDGLRVHPKRLGGTLAAKFDLLLLALEGEGEGIDLLFEYRSDLFDRAVVESWGQQYLCLLDALVAGTTHDVGSAPVLDPAMRQWLVDGCNRTQRPYPREATVIELFDGIVREHAARVAVVEADRSLTYGELAARADLLADRLREAGVRPGDRVALAMRRSTDLIVAMLATLRTGAAYVPLDPTYPEERRREMLTLAAPRAIVAPHGRTLAVTSLDGASAGSGDPDAVAAAYIMFTSGSTGTPKGVVVPHRGIVRLVRETDYVRFGPELVVAHLSNTSFDAATFEIWGALLNGARLVVLDNDTITQPTAFAEAVRAHGITTMFVTTALFNVIAREAPQAFAPLEHLLFGGEAADADAVRSVLAHGRPRLLANVYGPTESTTFASWYPIDRLAPHATVVPIGGPIANTTLHVVDERGEPVPPTVHGELVVGGDGLALGYLDDPELTASRFVDDPFSDEDGARLYRTGDIVRRRLDGVIEFVGRRDHQVKVRGFRIELGEIEAALRRLEPVHQAFVTTHRSEQGDASITGYVVASDGEPCDGDALRDALRAQLPAYMVPEAVIVVDALPMNANGKIDRAALPAPTRRPTRRPEPAVTAELASRDPLVAVLIELFAAVLERRDIGPDDDFFVLGGTSVRAVRLFAAVDRRLGVRLALSTLLEAPTPRALAERLRREHGIATPDDHRLSDATDPVLVTLRAGDPQRRPRLVAVHPAGGQLFVYAPLLAALPDDQPVIGIKEHGWGDPDRRLESVEEYAARYVDELLAADLTDGLVLSGYSLGGLLAYEMARLFDARGHRPRLVVLLDAAPVARPGDAPVLRQPALTKLRRRHTRDGVRGVVRGAGRILERAVADRVVDPIVTAADQARFVRAVRQGGPIDPLLVGRESERHGLVLRQRYRPGPYGGPVVAFRALGTDPDFPIADLSYRWRSVADRLDIVDVPGNHANEGSMLHPPHAAVVGRELAALLDGLVRSPDDRGQA